MHTYIFSAQDAASPSSALPATPAVASHDALAGLAPMGSEAKPAVSFGFAGGRPSSRGGGINDVEDLAPVTKAPAKSLIAKRLEKEGGKGMKKLSAFFGAPKK